MQLQKYVDIFNDPNTDFCFEIKNQVTTKKSVLQKVSSTKLEEKLVLNFSQALPHINSSHISSNFISMTRQVFLLKLDNVVTMLKNNLSYHIMLTTTETNDLIEKYIKIIETIGNDVTNNIFNSSHTFGKLSNRKKMAILNFIVSHDSSILDTDITCDKYIYKADDISARKKIFSNIEIIGADTYKISTNNIDYFARTKKKFVKNIETSCKKYCQDFSDALNYDIGNMIHDKISDIFDDLDIDAILSMLKQLSLKSIVTNFKLIHNILPKNEIKLVKIFNKYVRHVKNMQQLLQQSKSALDKVIGKHDIYYSDIDNHIRKKISSLMCYTSDIVDNKKVDVINYIGDIITNTLDDYYAITTLNCISKNIQIILADFSDDKKILQKINCRYYSAIQQSIFSCNVSEDLLEKTIDRCIMEISDNTSQLHDIINIYDKYISILDEILQLENITINNIMNAITDDKIKYFINKIKCKCGNVPMQIKKIESIKNKLINKKKFLSEVSIVSWNKLSQELATEKIGAIAITDSDSNSDSDDKISLTNIFNTSISICNTALIITGHLLEINEKFCKPSISDILIFSTGCVRIKRIVAHSKNVVIISSVVIFEDSCEIILSGKKSNYVADGLPGKSSGNLSIFSTEVKNFKKTYVDVTGSAGSTGATGADGIDGANGNIGCASSTKEELSEIIPVNKRNSKIERYQRIATFRGTKGTAGTDATCGGPGGCGGYGGLVKVINFDDTKNKSVLIEYCGSNGADGADGIDGKPGIGGCDGDNYVEYRGHKHYTRHSENVSVNTRATDGIVKKRFYTPIPVTPVTILTRDVIYAAYNKYLDKVNHSMIFKLLFSKQVIRSAVLLENN